MHTYINIPLSFFDLIKMQSILMFINQWLLIMSIINVDHRLPMEVVRRREKKWLSMLKNWDRFMQNKWVKIRDRCRKGIPESVRGLAWFHLCAAHKHRNKNPNLFAMLARQPGKTSSSWFHVFLYNFSPLLCSPFLIRPIHLIAWTFAFRSICLRVCVPRIKFAWCGTQILHPR